LLRNRKSDKVTRIDHQDATNVDEKGIAFTIRSVFIIDPKKTIRLILSYPASTGRNSAEVLRVLDSLQTGDKHRITTPIDWIPGDDVIVHPGVKNEEAKTLFPDFRIVKVGSAIDTYSTLKLTLSSLISDLLLSPRRRPPPHEQMFEKYMGIGSGSVIAVS
jgi:hypothetical protein